MTCQVLLLLLSVTSCLHLGILSLPRRYFPTILIVILAVMNDGAMIALSKDRVTPSPTPNCWRLRDIFITGIVYGLYLTLSTWVLYHVGEAAYCHMTSMEPLHSLLVELS